MTLTAGIGNNTALQDGKNHVARNTYTSHTGTY